jgi:NADH-quinone oxidoreductase subunit E
MAFPLSEATRRRIGELAARYPKPAAALLPALHLVQDEVGHIPDEAAAAVAEALALPPAHVHGVVTFYTMFRRQPVGRYFLQVCTNVACMALDGYRMLAHLEKTLGIRTGETTPDGLFTLVEVECLAACGQGPMMLVNQDYVYNLDEAKLDALLADLRRQAQGAATVPVGPA